MKYAKHTRTNVALAGLAVAALLVGVPTQAYGYVDPGTGSFAYQAAYAAFIGGAFYFRKLIQRLRGKNVDPNR